MRLRCRHRRGPPGGIVTYGTERLHSEVAYIAYHLHWSFDTILDLEHADRQRYVRSSRKLAQESARR
ncbi:MULTISPECIES: DUF6760 family protein [unclassified Rhodococcus (in: high G+C Gram-positive bacteria)]|uniref:DUF6760 family protein n=1 Tax=unclassified Rhodococcus (in: high G+C Gram-positive bacteria) TaxID=192944 RepID=UPI00111524E1|nr:DUF6760 family protein [Rhodococcus sp. M8]